MKLFIHPMVTGTAAALLLFVGTGMAHAQKGGSGARGGSSQGGSSAKMGQPSGQGYKASNGQKHPGSSPMMKSNNHPQHHNPSQMHHQQNFYYGTPWKNNCYPSNWNYGCWNTSFAPFYRTPYFAYPSAGYCYTPPVVYQATRVIVVQQPLPPVVETVTTSTTSATTGVVRQPGFTGLR